MNKDQAMRVWAIEHLHRTFGGHLEGPRLELLVADLVLLVKTGKVNQTDGKKPAKVKKAKK